MPRVEIEWWETALFARPTRSLQTFARRSRPSIWRRYVPSAILIGIPRSRAPSQCKGQRQLILGIDPVAVVAWTPTSLRTGPHAMMG
jgi:hypothetical protein